MIVVAGEALIDLLVHPDGSLRPSPVAGRSIRRGHRPARRRRSRSSGASRPTGSGATLRDALAADGVDLSMTATTDAPTTLAVAELDERGTRRRIGSTWPRRRRPAAQRRHAGGRAGGAPRGAPRRDARARAGADRPRDRAALAARRPTDAGDARPELPARRRSTDRAAFLERIGASLARATSSRRASTICLPRTRGRRRSTRLALLERGAGARPA